MAPTGVPASAGIVADGSARRARSVGVGPSALFEFRSITKTMTAQVLATLVVDCTVSLDDPVGRWLDAGENGDITLEQLARHNSGLPRVAGNAADGAGYDDLDPYASYTAELAEAALREAQPDPERFGVYSNLGYQLLGLALGRAAGQPLQALFDKHVFRPFGLRTAALGPHPKLVQGTRDGEPTPPWDILLAGPGGVVGTIDDLLAWGSAALEPPRGRHGDALSLATRGYDDGLPVGLGWQLHNDLLWHNGGTWGFHACLVVSPRHHRVAATLIATSDLDHVDDATTTAATRRDLVRSPGGVADVSAALTSTLSNSTTATPTDHPTAVVSKPREPAICGCSVEPLGVTQVIETEGLAHIHLFVADLDRSLRFYREVFGLEEMFRSGPKMVFLKPPNSTDTITLNEDADKAGPGGGVDHFGFRLADPSQLDRAIEEVERAGGRLLERGEHAPSAPYAYVADPDGYMIEL